MKYLDLNVAYKFRHCSNFKQFYCIHFSSFHPQQKMFKNKTITAKALIVVHPFSCMYFIHKRSTSMKKGWTTIQAFTVITRIIIFSQIWINYLINNENAIQPEGPHGLCGVGSLRVVRHEVSNIFLIDLLNCGVHVPAFYRIAPLFRVFDEECNLTWIDIWRSLYLYIYIS